MTRKYQTSQKTTTDTGKREYQKQLMRDIRKKRRAEAKKIVDSHMHKFQDLPKDEQQKAKRLLTKAVTTFLIRLDEKEQQLTERIESRINNFYDNLTKNIKELIELEKIIKKGEE